MQRWMRWVLLCFRRILYATRVIPLHIFSLVLPLLDHDSTAVIDLAPAPWTLVFCLLKTNLGPQCQ